MLALVSPAKKLDFTELAAPLPHSQPEFLERSKVLVESARKLSRADLSRLMKTSDRLTELCFQRFRAFAPPFTAANARQAVLAFRGDTYIGLDAAGLGEDDLLYAQDHLRIVSALYGLLRPLDLIQPYRLEMASRLATPEGADLYDFWADDLADAVDRAVSNHTPAVVVNLASNEYFRAVRPKHIKARIITPVFKEERDGQARVLGLFAKRARGMMARYIIVNRIADPEMLKNFEAGGYAYQDHLSGGDELVFTRAR